MGEPEIGTAGTYEQLVSSLADNSLFQKTGITPDALAKANDVLTKLTATNLALQQFGFYKRVANSFKKGVNQMSDDIQQEIAKPKVPLGTEGTELKEFKPSSEAVPSEELTRTEQGIGRVIAKEPLETPVQTTPSAPLFSAEEPSFESFRNIGGLSRSQLESGNLFPNERGLPSIEFESRAPLFLGQSAGDEGVLARGGRVQAQPPSQPDVAEPAPQAPVSAQAPEDVADEDVRTILAGDETPESAIEARVALNTLGGETQSIQGSMLGRFSDYYKQVQDIRTSVESGIARFQNLRTQANEVVSGLKEQANQKLAQGRQALQDAQDSLARGEEGASDMVKQAQSQIDDAISSSQNLDIVNDSVSKAQDFITRGNSLIAQGKQEGIALLEQGQEQLKVAQSAVQGYAGQGQALASSLQTELESRTSQINEFAEGLAQKASQLQQTGSDIAGAVSKGDVEGATQGLQSGVKQLGKLSADAGIEGGEETAGAIADAIPVVGEVVSAGLFIASLFTGIAEAFKPHHPLPIVNQASVQYGL